MEISDIDVPLVAEHVRKFAEAEPYRSETCRYFDIKSGQALCIVGHALALQGMGVEDIGDDFENGTYIATVLGTLGDEYPETLEWLGAVQYKQDEGWGWRSAVQWADTDGNKAP